MNDIEISKKFQPLFQLLDSNKFKNVDTVILTGGRASSKSFNVALLCLIGVVQEEWKVLFTRFTNSSIKDSIKAEVVDKIDLLNYPNLVKDTNNRIEALNNNGFIAFKGINVGSKSQTANLKSLSGFNVFVVDEAEEIPDYKTFKQVYYSIRSIDRRNLSILILNPTTKDNWIYKKMFFENKVKEGFCGVKDNIMYIHSSYLDINSKHIPPNIMRDYECLKIENRKEYDNIVMGGWLSVSEGMLFAPDDLNYYQDLPPESELISKLAFVDVADSGTDNHSVPIGYVYSDGRIYIEDVLFTTLDMTSNVPLTVEILNRHKVDYCRVETNYGGNAYILLMTEDVKTELMGAKATTNKHARIINSQYLVRRNVYFRQDYKQSPDYLKFMNNLLNYQRDGKSEHDDAADSLEGLIMLARGMFDAL